MDVKMIAVFIGIIMFVTTIRRAAGAEATKKLREEPQRQPPEGGSRTPQAQIQPPTDRNTPNQPLSDQENSRRTAGAEATKKPHEESQRKPSRRRSRTSRARIQPPTDRTTPDQPLSDHDNSRKMAGVDATKKPQEDPEPQSSQGGSRATQSPIETETDSTTRNQPLFDQENSDTEKIHKSGYRIVNEYWVRVDGIPERRTGVAEAPKKPLEDPQRQSPRGGSRAPQTQIYPPTDSSTPNQPSSDHKNPRRTSGADAKKKPLEGPQPQSPRRGSRATQSQIEPQTDSPEPNQIWSNQENPDTEQIHKSGYRIVNEYWVRVDGMPETRTGGADATKNPLVVPQRQSPRGGSRAPQAQIQPPSDSTTPNQSLSDHKNLRRTSGADATKKPLEDPQPQTPRGGSRATQSQIQPQTDSTTTNQSLSDHENSDSERIHEAGNQIVNEYWMRVDGMPGSRTDGADVTKKPRETPQRQSPRGGSRAPQTQIKPPTDNNAPNQQLSDHENPRRAAGAKATKKPRKDPQHKPSRGRSRTSRARNQPQTDRTTPNQPPFDQGIPDSERIHEAGNQIVNEHWVRVDGTPAKVIPMPLINPDGKMIDREDVTQHKRSRMRTAGAEATKKAREDPQLKPSCSRSRTSRARSQPPTDRTTPNLPSSDQEIPFDFSDFEMIHQAGRRIVREYWVRVDAMPENIVPKPLLDSDGNVIDNEGEPQVVPFESQRRFGNETPQLVHTRPQKKFKPEDYYTPELMNQEEEAIDQYQQYENEPVAQGLDQQYSLLLEYENNKWVLQQIDSYHQMQELLLDLIEGLPAETRQKTRNEFALIKNSKMRIANWLAPPFPVQVQYMKPPLVQPNPPNQQSGMPQYRVPYIIH